MADPGVAPQRSAFPAPRDAPRAEQPRARLSSACLLPRRRPARCDLPLLTLLALLCAAPARASSPLEGTWRFDVVVRTRARVPLLGEAVVETHKVMLSRIAADGAGGLAARHVACGMVARSDKAMTETWFPEGFIAAMGEQAYPLLVQGAPGGTTLAADVDPVTLGWDPAQSGGAMPRRAGEAGVVDADEDGHPGVTVWVRAPLFGTVEVYLVQHSLTRIEGALLGEDLARGVALVTHLDQRVLGASNPLFRANVPLSPDPDGGWFELRRVPAHTTCDSLDAASPPPEGSPAADRAPRPAAAP